MFLPTLTHSQWHLCVHVGQKAQNSTTSAKSEIFNKTHSTRHRMWSVRWSLSIQSHDTLHQSTRHSSTCHSYNSDRLHNKHHHSGVHISAQVYWGTVGCWCASYLQDALHSIGDHSPWDLHNFFHYAHPCQRLKASLTTLSLWELPNKSFNSHCQGAK